MNPEKIVELINKARAILGQEPITVEQYQATIQGGSQVAKRHRAAQEAGRRNRARIELSNKYPGLGTGNPLARSYYFLMKEEKTPEDAQYNSQLHEKCMTPGGVEAVIEDAVKRISQLPASVYFPKDEAEMISNYEKYGDLMDVMFNMHLMRADMKINGMKFTPEVENFLETHKGLFDVVGMQTAVINTWASPFYVGFDNMAEDTFAAILVAAGSNMNDKSPEQTEFKLFSINCPVESTTFAENQVTIKGGRILMESGQAENMKYAEENLYEKAKKAAPGDVVKTLSPDKMADMDKALSGMSIESDARPYLEAGRLLDKGVFRNTDIINFRKADEKLVMLFGQKFQYDEVNLAGEVYSRDNFKVSDYELPKDCPFTEKEAAFIGMAAMATEGIGDISRQDVSKFQRLSGNYGFCAENMIYGLPRKGVGPLIHGSIDTARHAIVPIINGYMGGDKTPLAMVLASLIRMSSDFHLSSAHLNKGCIFEGRNLRQAFEMIDKDPELGEIIRKNNLISEREYKAGKIGSLLSRCHEERFELLDRFHKDVKAGKEPSKELKTRLVAVILLMDAASEQKNLDDTAFTDSAEFQAKTAEIMAQVPAGNGLELNVRLDALHMKAPVFPFTEKLLQPGGMETLGRMIAGTEAAKRLVALNSNELVKFFKLDTQMDNLMGHFCAEVREELSGFKAFKETIVMDVSNTKVPASTESLRDDAELLGRLCKGMSDAQLNVHLGSDEFDAVARDLKLIEMANKRLKADPALLTERTADILKRSYANLEADCNAYLQRKERQGKLNVDPQSKTGKRIKMIREALKFSRQGKARYEATENMLKNKEINELQDEAGRLLYESLTAETAGILVKNLNKIAGENTDPQRGQKIVKQLTVVQKFFKDKNLDLKECKLTQEDIDKSVDLVKAGGVGQKPKEEPEIKALV